MPETDSLGAFEQLILTAIVALGGDAYGVTIHAKVEELARPRKVSLGAVYVTLDRLEDKRYISSELSEPTAARGGRSKRAYVLETRGVRALELSTVTAKRMCDTITEAWGKEWLTQWRRQWLEQTT